MIRVVSDFEDWFDSTITIQETQSDLLTRVLGEFKYLFESAFEAGYETASDKCKKQIERLQEGKYY